MNCERTKTFNFYMHIVVCSRCLVHHPHEVQIGKSHSFLAAFHRETPLLVGPTRDSESTEFSEVGCTTRGTIMAAPVKRCIFFVFEHFNVVYALHGLAVQCKVMSFVFELVC